MSDPSKSDFQSSANVTGIIVPVAERITSTELDALLPPRSSSRAVDMNHYQSAVCVRRLDEAQIVNLDTGELSNRWCSKNSCPHCGSVQRWRIARAVSASRPTHVFTLTLAGNEFTTISRKMKALQKNLTRKGYPMKWVWKVECNSDWPNGHRNHHVQGLAYGNVPETWTFTECAERAGFGSAGTQIYKLNDLPREVRYLWRKRTKFRALDLQHILVMNGGAYHRASRGFWRLDGDQVTGGLREVTKRLREAQNGSSLPVELRLPQEHTERSRRTAS